MQIDARIPLMAQGPQPDQRMNMLAQIMQFQQMAQRNKLLEQEQLLKQSQVEHENALRPYQMQKLQAEIAALPALEAQRMAQVAEQQRKAQLADRQVQGQNALLNMLATGGYQGTVSPGAPQNVMLDENAARQKALEMDAANKAAGTNTPIGINVPNPSMIRSAAILADPSKSIDSLLKTINPTGSQFSSATPGSIIYDRRTGLPVGNQVPFRPEASDKNVVIVQTPEGPRYAPRQDAPGAIPAPAIPAGYRLSASGSIEPIPGGPADTKITGQFNADTATLESSTAALNRLGEQVNLLKNSKLGRITGIPGALPNIPGSAGSDAQARLEALRSQVGFSVLQSLRDASRTNASGLGQVTEKEHALLQNQLGNLAKAQSEQELRRVLDGIAKFVDESKGRLQNAYNVRNKNRLGSTQAEPAQSSPALPSISDIDAEIARRGRGRSN